MPVIRRASTAGHASAIMPLSAARPASGSATHSHCDREAASTATAAQPDGSTRTRAMSHGALRSRSAVTSQGRVIPATEMTLIASAVTMVPTSWPRRAPGPSMPPATVPATPTSTTVSTAPATPTIAAAIPA